MLKVFQLSEPVTLHEFVFPGGERQVRLTGYATDNEAWSAHSWTLKAQIRSAEDIMSLLLTRNAIRYIDPLAQIYLECPYLPYARQDRPCHPGEAFSLEVMAHLLNAAEFARILVWDVHSDVAHKLIPNLYSLPAANLLKGHLKTGEIVVAPDKGALRRATEVAGADHVVITTEKVRNPDNGRLTDFHLLSDMTGIDTTAGAIIVDDICDGGRTFTGVAKVIRPHVKGPLRLYVTHGIFSAGFDDLLAAYDEILVANVMTEKSLPKNILSIA